MNNVCVKHFQGQIINILNIKIIVACADKNMSCSLYADISEVIPMALTTVPFYDLTDHKYRYKFICSHEICGCAFEILTLNSSNVN